MCNKKYYMEIPLSNWDSPIFCLQWSHLPQQSFSRFTPSPGGLATAQGPGPCWTALIQEAGMGPRRICNLKKHFGWLKNPLGRKQRPFHGQKLILASFPLAFGTFHGEPLTDGSAMPDAGLAFTSHPCSLTQVLVWGPPPSFFLCFTV